jgi:acetyl esterase/lipase
MALQGQPMPISDGQLLPLWPAGAPGALGTADADVPAITVYLPRTMAANTPAMIVCPGGGYGALASNHEGRQVANYLNSLGMAAFVLRYRLGPKYQHPIELGDAQRAIRTVRARAAQWRIDPGASASWDSRPAATSRCRRARGRIRCSRRPTTSIARRAVPTSPFSAIR